MGESLRYSTIWLIVFVAIVIAILPILIVSADPGITFVKGQITDPDGEPVKGADVNVVCRHGEEDFSKSTTSHGKGVGKYLVYFSTEECDTGDLVKVCATKGEMSGCDSGKVEQWSKGRGAKINVATVNVVIPEFGLIAGIITLLGSGIGFWIIRKRGHLIKNRT